MPSSSAGDPAPRADDATAWRRYHRRVKADESGDEHVELLRSTDPVRVGLVRGLLEREGIVVSTPGYEANGVMPHLRNALEIVVRVPRSQREAAQELIDGMRDADDARGAGTAPSARGTTKPSPSPRLKRIAAAATFVFPGGSHFYVQRYVGGLGVVGGYVLALVAIGLEVPLAGYLLAVPWLADLRGGLDGCDASRVSAEASKGAPSSPVGRAAPWLAIAFVGAWSALALGPLLPALAGSESVAWCAYLARCEGADERACLVRGANGFGGLAPPHCLECVREEQACALVRERCTACWPSAAPVLFLPVLPE